MNVRPGLEEVGEGFVPPVYHLHLDRIVIQPNPWHGKPAQQQGGDGGADTAAASQGLDVEVREEGCSIMTGAWHTCAYGMLVWQSM